MNRSISLIVKILLPGSLIPLACSLFSAPVTPASTPIPAVQDLQFEDPQTGQRFQALEACIQNMLDDSWQGTGYQMLGNFYESAWCRGVGSNANCSMPGEFNIRPDQQVIQLYTLFYPQDFPEVFGLGFQAAYVPPDDGCGASFYFAEDGKMVMGGGWAVTFHQNAGAGLYPNATLSLGDDYSYRIGENTVEFSSSLSAREDLAKYFSSPEAMRDRGLEGIGALAQTVEAEIRSGNVPACDLQPYQGNGIPPACIPRPMTEGEMAQELARAKEHFDSQEQILREAHEEMYAAWMAAFPLNQCWPA